MSFPLLAAAGLAAALQFPAGFKWCVATAAHQIEGNNTNSDWWAFEQVPGHIKRGETSGAACDHWNRVAEDTELMQALHVGTYRFSVEWAKLEPSPGVFDADAEAHYVDEIARLRHAGIEPLITLQHFTLPQWVAAQGGWAWPGIADAFERFVDRVYQRVAPDVRDFVTINEPTVVLAMGYIAGEHAPGKQDLGGIGAPAEGMVRAHAKAYHRLHELAAAAGRTVRVGLAHHLRPVQPYRAWNPVDLYATRLMDDLFNWSILDAVETGTLKLNVPFLLNVDVAIPDAAHTEDFYGINYYSRDFVKFAPFTATRIERPVPAGAPVTDLGWEIYPEGIYTVIADVTKRHGPRPVIITENGLADAADAKRAQFLQDHLVQLHRAIADGYQVEAYCHWSLMDNFEWAEGFAPRFGLYAVDYATQTRTLRPSGRLYSEIARTNTVNQ